MTTLVAALVAAFYFGVNPVNWLSPGKMTTGVVSLSHQGSCLDFVDNSEAAGTHLQVFPCDPSVPNAAQRWSFSEGRIIHRTDSGKELCVDIPNNDRTTGNHVQVWSCSGVGFPQQSFKHSDNLIMTTDGGTCLAVAEDGKMVQLKKCARVDSSQTWSMTASPSAFLSQLRGPLQKFSKVLAERV